MSAQGHDAMRDALGAYTLGALDPAERALVDSHLADCQDCREELARFAGLPGLLSRLTAKEAATGLVTPERGSAERAALLVAGQQQAAARRMRRWQLLAVAAIAGVVLLSLPLLLPGPEPALILEPRAAAADAAETAGWLSVTDRRWGMAIELELRGLPAREGYSLVAITDEDHRATAASWSATDDGQVTLSGSCYVTRERLSRMEVVTSDDEVVLVFDL